MLTITSVDETVRQGKVFADTADEEAKSGRHDNAVIQYYQALNLLCTPETMSAVWASQEAQELIGHAANRLFELDAGSFREIRALFRDYLTHN